MNMHSANHRQSSEPAAGEPERPKAVRSIMARHMQPRHRRAVKAIGFALTLDSATCWGSTGEILALRLTPRERVAMTVALLAALPQADAETAIHAGLGGAGYPLPPFLSPVSDAQWWADRANLSELRAYCLASFRAMPARDRRDFLEFVARPKP